MNNACQSNLIHRSVRISATWLLPLLLLSLLAVVQAQSYTNNYGIWTYTTANGTITITRYSGPAGDLSIPERIPDTINGLPVTSIGWLAFNGCTNLARVMIPNTVTNIGEYPFGGCRSLTAITVDAQNPVYSSSTEGVLFNKSQTTLIQYPAFRAGSYTIPSGVTSIGDWAFGWSTPLTNVTIPNTVTNIGNAAFDSCYSLTSVTVPNSVTSIGRQAFDSCFRLINVALGNSITSIGDYTFGKCTSLANITIPNSVTKIGDLAFWECSSLTEITIPDSVTSIGYAAFQDCTSLTGVTIPSSVTTIGNWTFISCTSLTGVYFKGNAPSPGLGVFDGDDNPTVYYLPGTTGWDSTFGGRPTALWQQPLPGAWTLSASTITTTGATLNGTVNPNGFLTAAWFQWGTTTNYGNLSPATGMGSGANALPLSAPLAGLTPGINYHYRVAASNSPYAVYGSDQSFTTLELPQVSTLPATGVSANSSTLNATINPNGWPTTAWFQWGATTNYGDFTSVTALGSGTTALPLSAPLAGLTPNTTYHFLAAASNANGSAYGSDQSFTTLGLPLVATLPATGVSTNSATLNGTINPDGLLTTAWFQWGATTNYGNLTPVTALGSGTTALPLSAPLAGLTPGTTFHFLAAASNAYGSAYGSDQSFTLEWLPTQFQYTTNYGTITITGYTGPGGDVSIPSIINGLPVTRIGIAAFYYCTNVTSVLIPSSVTGIDHVFYECTSLTTIIVDTNNPSYSSVDGVLFNKSQTTLILCPEGKTGSYTIPNSVTILGDGAFFGANLTGVLIPSSVAIIGIAAFSGCTNLTSVLIPSSVTSIEIYAFYKCTSLSAITVDALNPAYSSVDGVLLNKIQSALIQCPAGKGGSYTIPNSVTSIGNSAFSGCASLAQVAIPTSVTSIGFSAFINCTSLASVTIPDSVTSIGSQAFGNCTSLASITIPNSVTNIDIGMFENCSNLTRVTIPNSVSMIGDLAFAECSSLTEITIPNSVTNIGNQAFEGCSNLIGVYFQGNAPSLAEHVFDYWYWPPGTPWAISVWDPATIYYLPGTTGWGSTFAGRPTALWNPSIQTTNASFGVRTNQFGFTITGTANIPIVVEASVDLPTASWTSLQTCTLTNGSIYYRDPQWTTSPARLYRLRSP